MKNGNEKLKDKWIWVYGDECDFIWSHFNMSDRSDFDRMKLQFVEYKSEDVVGAGHRAEFAADGEKIGQDQKVVLQDNETAGRESFISGLCQGH